MVQPQLGALLPLRCVRGEDGDDVIDASRDAVAEIAGLEAGRDRVGDNDLCQRIGQRAFETVADLDANPPLLRRDQQQHAVVLCLLAKLPGAEQFVGVGFDLLAFERIDRGNDELDPGFRFKIREFRLEDAPRVCRNDIRLIDDAAGERRKRQRQGANERQQQRGSNDVPGSPHRAVRGEMACEHVAALGGAGGR